MTVSDFGCHPAHRTGVGKHIGKAIYVCSGFEWEGKVGSDFLDHRIRLIMVSQVPWETKLLRLGC